MHTQETSRNETIYTLQPPMRQCCPLSAKKKVLKYTKKHNLLLEKLGEISQNSWFFF